MSNPWFRFYAAALRNPKVAKLSDRDFRLWVSLLAAASENEGVLPPAKDLKHLLNARLDHLLTGLERLISGGLIDALEHGYTPHNWNKFQYKSDTSTERVRRHRDGRNVSETPPDTEQIQKQTKEPRAQQTPLPREPMTFDKLCDAAGFDPNRLPHPGLLKIGPIIDLIGKNYSLEADILPIIRELAAAKVAFQHWSYVVPIVIERTARRNAIPVKPAAPMEDWPGRLKVWREDRTWAPAWGPPPDDPKCRAPADLLKAAA